MADIKNYNKFSDAQIAILRANLLEWYALHERDVPWRVIEGKRVDPYNIWLSEIMCQQTTVQAVKAYYAKFLALWPNVEALAAAYSDAVMAAWAGLGYYARARNLHACAKIVAKEYDGVFPDSYAALKTLPGIGDYTASAIAAIAYGQSAVIVDGNVERVMARFFAVREAFPQSKPLIISLAAVFYKGLNSKCGELAQALMDLGASVCIAKKPRCGICPLKEGCLGYKKGVAETLPNKVKKVVRPQKYGAVYLVQNTFGEALFEKRATSGLLAGMVGMPTTEWVLSNEISHPSFLSNLVDIGVQIEHVFTHFSLVLHLYKAEILDQSLLDKNSHGLFYWADPDLEHLKMPTVFIKPYNAFVKVD